MHKSGKYAQVLHLCLFGVIHCEAIEELTRVGVIGIYFNCILTEGEK